MGLQVLLVGRLRPELGVSGVYDGVAVADVRHPDAVHSAVERLATPHAALLLVCQYGDLTEVRRHVSLVSVALPGVAVSLEPLPGTPLAVAAGAALAVAAAGHGVGAQLAVLDELRTQLWSAVWLPSVTMLTWPQPSMWQHVRSWLPGAGFLAVHGRPPRVLAARSAPLPELTDVPLGGHAILADSDAPEWVVTGLVAAIQTHDERHVGSWRSAPDAFGVEHAVEVAVLAAELRDEQHWRSASAAAICCAGCGREHSREACPFCRMSAAHTVAVTGIAGVRGGAVDTGGGTTASPHPVTRPMARSER